MNNILIFVICFQFVTVTASVEDSSMVGAVIGSIAAILCVLILFVLGYYCYRKKKQYNNSRHPTNLATEPHSFRNQELFNVSVQPPPSYFQNEYNNNNKTKSKKPGNVLYDQPPSYSSHMQLYHTHTSGQPVVLGNSIRGVDNPAFLNHSVSSFNELPSMADVLLTSSKLSIPAAIKAEERQTRTHKLSDSAQGDSIESRVVSNGSRFAFDNPQFSTSFEEDHQKREDILNRRFESYTDSESELQVTDMGGRWLGSIKNHSQSHLRNNRINQEMQFSKPDKTSPKKSKHKPKSHQKLEESTSHHHNDTIIKTRKESSDSGAEVSSNPRGSKNKQNHSNETRTSRISSDSGLGEVTVKVSISRSKSVKNVVHKHDQKPNRSVTTDV